MTKALWVLRLPEEAELHISEKDQVTAGDLLASVGKKKYQSKVGGTITSVKPDRVEVSFQAEKITGDGFGKTRRWGRYLFLGQGNFTDLSIDCRNRIVFIESVDQLFLAKSSALGVSGLVCFESHLDAAEGEASEIPILIVDSKAKLDTFFEKLKDVKCLIDPVSGCLLVPEKK